MRSLLHRHADFARVTADALDDALTSIGLEDASLRGRLLAAYPEVPSMLAQLRRRGLLSAILSNGEPETLRDAVAAAGLAGLLDHLLWIEAVGVIKPDRRVYQHAQTILGLRRERVGFVSANAWDAHGAATFGFSAWWVNRTGAPAEPLPGELAGVLADLAGLPAQIGG